MGRKVGDNWTVPLCGGCHHRLHNDPLGEKLFWADNGIDAKEEAMKNFKVREQGEVNRLSD